MSLRLNIQQTYHKTHVYHFKSTSFNSTYTTSTLNFDRINSPDTVALRLYKRHINRINTLTEASADDN